MTVCLLCESARLGGAVGVVGGVAEVGRVAEEVPRYRGYRVPSARLPGFDYGRGVFFVTVVTKERVPWFGRVGDSAVVPSWAGRVVVEERERTGRIRPGVTLDAFVAMPDHVHGVIAIDGYGRVGPGRDGGGGRGADPKRVTVETPRRGVSTDRGADPWRPGVLGAVVGRIKSERTRRIRKRHPGFAWPSRFYDVVIRDDRHLDAARRYIADNPLHHGPP